MDREIADYVKANLRVREICEERGMTVRELSEACGFLRPQQMSNIINGRSASIAMLVKVARTLGVPLGDIFVHGDQVPEARRERSVPQDPYRCPTCGQRISRKKAKLING